MKRLHELHDVNSDVERLWPEPVTRSAERAPSKPISPTADQEIAALKACLEERDDTLRKSSRRIDRLIGEKTQLKALLEKRDREIRELYRELGGHRSRGWSSRASGEAAAFMRRSPLAHLASIGERFRAWVAREPAAGEGTKAIAEAAASATSASQSLSTTRHVRSKQGVVIILMVGLDKEEIERLLPIVERDCASRNMAPLCLVDIDAFEMLRARDLVFEYLPPSDDRDRFDASLHWDLYMQRRLALIRRKWDPVRIVAFGAQATRTLRLWSSSPFEDLPLPVGSGEASGF